MREVVGSSRGGGVGARGRECQAADRRPRRRRRCACSPRCGGSAIRGARRAAQARRRGPRPHPPERRAGGRRRRRLPAAARRRRRLQRPPRARPRDRQGRAARPRAWPSSWAAPTGCATGSAARCTSSTSSTGSWARPASSAATSRSPWAARSRRGCAAATRSPSCSSATAPCRPGHFNETINLATLWGCPLILVCENNGFAEFTPRRAHTKVERVSDVVAPYGLERETVDGNDVVAVWDGVRPLPRRRRARGGGPMLLECLTHRLRGHYEGDPAKYREAIAEDEWQEQDPILRLQRRGIAAGLVRPRTTPRRSSATPSRRSRRRSRSRATSPFPPRRARSTELVYA